MSENTAKGTTYIILISFAETFWKRNNYSFMNTPQARDL